MGRNIVRSRTIASFRKKHAALGETPELLGEIMAILPVTGYSIRLCWWRHSPVKPVVKKFLITI
jgi:hypothetical protein